MYQSICTLEWNEKIKIVQLFFNCEKNLDLPDCVVRKSILFFLKINSNLFKIIYT